MRHEPLRKRAPPVVIGLSMVVTLGLLLAICPLGVLAVQQRVLAPPHFAVQIGDLEFAAPCPSGSALICDESTPWYAIWRSNTEPDGSITSRQLFFMYLRHRRR